MADSAGPEKKRGDAAPVEGGNEPGPGEAFKDFETMSSIVNKLKLLNYDEAFCQRLKFKPFSAHYFAIKTNPGEQFWNFGSLAAWLIRECGKQFDQPQEYDDPNATISGILDACRQMGITVSFPPNKLKEGHGPNCLYILNFLCDEALKAKRFAFERPRYIEEGDDRSNVVVLDDDESDMVWKARDDAPVHSGDDVADAVEEESQHLLDLNSDKGFGMGGDSKDSDFRLAAALESTADASEWKLEVERVLPELKVTIRTDPRDWRVHLDQFSHQSQGLTESVKTLKGELDKLTAEIGKTMEKISSREKYVSSQLDAQLVQYREAQNRLNKEKERYKSASTGIVERQRILNEVNDELENIKRTMRDRGSSMTDAQPLRNIKETMSLVKKEVGQLEVRIGVVEHCLIQAKLTSKHDNFSMEGGDISDPILASGLGANSVGRLLSGGGAAKQIVV